MKSVYQKQVKYICRMKRHFSCHKLFYYNNSLTYIRNALINLSDFFVEVNVFPIQIFFLKAFNSNFYLLVLRSVFDL